MPSHSSALVEAGDSQQRIHPGAETRCSVPPQTGDLTMLRGVAGDHSTGALPHDARRTVWAPGRVSEPGIPNGIASGAMCHYRGCRDMPLIRDFIAEHEQALDCADHVVRARWASVIGVPSRICSGSCVQAVGGGVSRLKHVTVRRRPPSGCRA